VVGRRDARVAAGRPSFVVSGDVSRDVPCVLDENAARHLRVLRLDVGADVAVRNGAGLVAAGRVVRLTKSLVQVEVSDVEVVEPLPAVHLLVPVADRDRMLWLAEKATELGCTTWRPVLWRRSRSVTPRGEGIAFQQRVRARMESALAQSEGAWLPQLFPEAPLDRALLAAPSGVRLTLDPNGGPLADAHATLRDAPVTLAIGPEGGIEDEELTALDASGFTRVRLGPTVLRFETAAIAALAAARGALDGV
jgi:16S rRNA (uracil1498-N3)-methyltransferase